MRIGRCIRVDAYDDADAGVGTDDPLAAMLGQQMATSAAATAKFISTNTCPASLPSERLKAANTMLAPESMSSTHISMMMVFRRITKPTMPIRKSAAARMR